MANQQKLIQKVQLAIEQFQRGQMDEAKTLLEDACGKKVAVDVAYFLLATIYFQLNKLELARQYYLETLKLNPKHHEANNNLGVIAEKLKDIDTAIKHYKKAIELKPNYANGLFHLGNALHNQNRFDEAANYYERVLAIDPQHLKSLNNLGLVYIELKKPEKAFEVLTRAVQINPHDAELFTNVGYALREMGNDDEAIRFFEMAVAIDSGFAGAYNNLALTHQNKNDFETASRYYLSALNSNPNNAEILTNYANLLNDHGHHDKAAELYRRAIALDSNYVNAWNNLAGNLRYNGKIDEAIEAYNEGIKRSPHSAELRYNLGVAQLGRGQFEQGWANYRYRASFQAYAKPTFTERLPTDLTGKRVFLIHDQGIGDELFFLRFTPTLKQRGAYIIYCPQPKIRNIVAQFSTIDELVDEQADIKCDYTISIGNLPFALHTKDDTPLPSALPLSASPAAINLIRNELGKLGPGPFIGVTWRGGVNMKRVLFKEIPIESVANALQNVSAQLIVLQRNPTTEEIDLFRSRIKRPVHDFSHLNDDLETMLAMLSVLDDYVGVSNTNMHLAASLKRTARVLIPHPGEWRWMAEGSTSPWFPGFSVYRQSASYDWTNALTQLDNDLQNRFSKNS